jgi:hypothetical protein
MQIQDPLPGPVIPAKSSLPSNEAIKFRSNPLETTKTEYYVPETASPDGTLAHYDKTKLEYYERQISWLTARLSELEMSKTEYYERKIALLNSKIGKYRTDQTDLRREVQDQRARVLYYCQQISVLAAQIDPLHARTAELEGQVRELEARLSGFARFHRYSRKLQRLYAVPLIGAILRGVVGSLIPYVRRL